MAKSMSIYLSGEGEKALESLKKSNPDLSSSEIVNSLLINSSGEIKNSIKLNISLNGEFSGKMKATDGKIVDLATCEVGSLNYWNGSNWSDGRIGHMSYVLKSVRGAFYHFRQTSWQGERDVLESISEEEARDLLAEYPDKYIKLFGEMEANG